MSEAAPATLRRAAKVHPIAPLQSEYSLWTHDVEAEILPVCRELGIGFVPYSLLGRGFLTGKIKQVGDLAASDWRRNGPRFQGDNFRQNLSIVSRIEALAKRKGCKPAQLALAWVLAQGEDIVPVPGTKRRTANRTDISGSGGIQTGRAGRRHGGRPLSGSQHGPSGPLRCRAAARFDNW